MKQPYFWQKYSLKLIPLPKGQ